MWFCLHKFNQDKLLDIQMVYLILRFSFKYQVLSQELFACVDAILCLPY